MRSEMRGGCGACGRFRKSLPGGFGHHVRRYYGRCAGCCRWTGTGARRVTPLRAASQETWPEAEKPRPRNLGQSRGGAPEGERADRKARAASADAAPVNCAFRRSASLRFYLEAATFLAFVRKTRVQKTHRENEIAFLSAPAKAGEGDHWSSRSERTVVEGAQDSTLRYRCRKFSEQELGACVND
jgi:hypothetical protein